MDAPTVQKNTNGDLGPVCNSCGGYGFSLNLLGGSSGCRDCDQTGIAMPTKLQLQQQIDRLEVLVGGKK